MPREPIFIEIPPGIPPWLKRNLERIKHAFSMIVKLDDTVYSPTSGLATAGSKVKIDEDDTTANYLENKLIAGTGITLTESLTGGAGEKILTAAIGAHADLTDMPDTAGTVTDHDTRYVIQQSDAEPTVPPPYAGMVWYDTNEPFGTPFTIGDGAENDMELAFDTDTSDGSITFMGDEDYFKFADGILLNSTEEVFFRDTAISIKSADDGHLDITADTTIDMNGVVLATDKIAFTQTDLNEYIDSLADGYIDYRATTGHRFGDGTNYSMFSAAGAFTLTGTARVWKAVPLNPQLVKLPGANPPAEDNIDGFGFHRYDRGTEESVYYTWIVPNDFATGTASVRGYYGFVVDHPPAGGGANENVRMGFEYKKLTEGDVFDFSTGTSSGYLDETITAGETAGIIHLTTTGVCTTTGWAAHDKILFRFYRDATAVEDTYDNEASAADNDVWVKTYHLEYLSNSLGTQSS